MVPPPLKPGTYENGVLKNSLYKDDAKFKTPDFPTGYEAIMAGSAINPSAKMMGWRDVIKVDFEQNPKDPKKKYEKLTLSPSYSWLTYDEVNKKFHAFGAGLVHSCGVKPNDKILVYAETSKEWMIATMGAWSQRLGVVTSYATLGAEGVSFAIQQQELSTVIADSKLLKILLSVAPNCPLMKNIIATHAVPEEQQAKAKELGLNLQAMDDVIAQGMEKPLEPNKPVPEDLAVIMYTSGTTGNPKGVLLSHSNVAYACSGMACYWQELALFRGTKTTDSVYMGYLPLAHIMELVIELNIYSIGACVGYGSPHTLTDTSVKVAAGTRGDAPTLAPTLVLFAPAVIDKIKGAVFGKMKAKGGIINFLFNWALGSGKKRFNQGKFGAGGLWDGIIFKKVQALLGGRCQAMMVGSAPLNMDAFVFMQTAFNCPLRQGYALTETCCCGTVVSPQLNSQSVGAPVAVVHIKLRDWEEGGYRLSDADNPKFGMPRGEILIGGPTIAQGYFVSATKPDPDVVKKNEEEFTEIDGVRYFCTGDVGQITADGEVQIIDRKKDLVKMQQGEYVSLSKVEGACIGSPLVDQCLCYARGDDSYTVLVVVTNMRAAADVKAGLSGAELLADKEVNAAVLKSIQGLCKGKLAGFEVPKKVLLTEEPWNAENDMTTAALKLKRQNITGKYKEELASLYGKKA